MRNGIIGTPETGSPPDGSGRAIEIADRPARIVTPPKSSDTSHLTTIRRRKSVGRGSGIACLDGVCIDCTCGLAWPIEEADDGE